MDRTFLSARIDAVKLQIVEHEGALLAFAQNGLLQSYTLDTGQSRQTVTRSDLATINRQLDVLYNRLATLTARLTGEGVTQVGPAW